jgi:hypothetical protein
LSEALRYVVISIRGQNSVSVDSSEESTESGNKAA